MKNMGKVGKTVQFQLIIILGNSKGDPHPKTYKSDLIRPKAAKRENNNKT